MAKPIQRPRLGRGLSALLSGTHIEQTHDAGLEPLQSATIEPTIDVPNSPWRLIQVDQIVPNPHQPRRDMNEAELCELANSLKSSGLIQPIVVRFVDGGYQLIAGERRLRAAKLAGLAEIPAIVKEVDAYMQAQLALVENIHRADLNPIERAVAYSNLLGQLGLTQAELANRLGEQRSSVANYLRLLELAESVREYVRQGKLSLGHAKVLAGVSDHTEQIRLADLCLAQDLSVRNLERLLVVEDKPAITREVSQPSAHVKDLETSLTRQLGLRVQVRTSGKKGKGQVVIHYGNLDQFDELVRRLGVELEQI